MRSETLAIVGVTARALSQAARRSSSYAEARIVALDWFADRDLIDAADVAEAIPTRRSGGFDQVAVGEPVEREDARLSVVRRAPGGLRERTRGHADDRQSLPTHQQQITRAMR